MTIRPKKKEKKWKKLSPNNICIVKILLVPPKLRNNYGSIKLLIFQYCDCNIILFSISILLYLLCLKFYIFFSFFPLFLFLCDSCHSFLHLKAIAISFHLLFTIAFNSKKELQLSLHGIVGRGITIQSLVLFQ